LAMDPVIYFCLLLFLILPLYLLVTRKQYSRRLPPGSMGLPIIGQSLSFLRAMRNNTAEEWLRDRIRRYGPVSKMNLLGAPTIFLPGLAANKLIYTNGSILANQKPSSIRRLCGPRNILELTGNDHKRIRAAVVSFLKPEALKEYVGKMEDEVVKHFRMHWHGKQKVSALPLMRTLTFNLMTSLIFGLEQGGKRDILLQLFGQMLDGMLSVPVNLPFTRFSRSLQASSKIRTMIMDLIRERRGALLEQSNVNVSSQQDLITSFLGLRDDDQDNSVVISDQEIVDNALLVMLAGYDTSSVLLSFLIRILAIDPDVYAGVVQEQEEIAKSKQAGQHLTWDDLARMKYSWRVAMECLRMTPPVFSSFRKVLKDFEYEGYLIPKGWQVFTAAPMTHMDECIFPNPSKFDPTRFEKQSSSIPPYSFVAFGGGPRICPGYEFSRIETLITLHYLVTKFTWKLCGDASFCRDPMPTFKNGLEIQIEPKISCF
ncbi:hypothetical protein Tsubulata_003115, partial [Turnera subulata]